MDQQGVTVFAQRIISQSAFKNHSWQVSSLNATDKTLMSTPRDLHDTICPKSQNWTLSSSKNLFVYASDRPTLSSTNRSLWVSIIHRLQLYPNTCMLIITRWVQNPGLNDKRIHNLCQISLTELANTFHATWHYTFPHKPEKNLFTAVATISVIS